MSPRRSVIPIFIPHLGCPCRCVFCNQRSITALRTDTRKAPSPSEVTSAIEDGLLHAGREAELAFYGGSFTAIDKELRTEYLRAAYPFIRSGALSGIRISTRPDAIDEAILNELKHYGVHTIELGAQSMDDRVLELAQRGHKAKDTVDSSLMIKQLGFLLILQMMIGLPGELPGMAMQTAKELAALRPDGVRIYPVAVIKGTELEELWRQGSYSALTVHEASEICADLLAFFDSEGIPVIRVGLNPSEDLEGEVLAGVYHPAFGEICRSLLFLREARALLCERDSLSGKAVIFGVEPGKTSMFIGQHRKNAEALQSEFGLREIKIREITHSTGDNGSSRTRKNNVEIIDVY